MYIEKYENGEWTWVVKEEELIGATLVKIEHTENEGGVLTFEKGNTTFRVFV